MPRQFEVRRMTGLRPDSAVELAVVMQDDTLSHLTTRVVAPLVPVFRDVEIERSTPIVEINGRRYAVAMHLLTTVPVRQLGAMIGSLQHDDRKLMNALDMVFSGI
jgi:hypothetical protein